MPKRYHDKEPRQWVIPNRRLAIEAVIASLVLSEPMDQYRITSMMTNRLHWAPRHEVVAAIRRMHLCKRIVPVENDRRAIPSYILRTACQ